MPEKPDVQEQLTQISDIRDQRIMQRIVDNRHNQPELTNIIKRPLKPYCIGCRHADIHVVSTKRRWDYRTLESNELSIYCWKKAHIINLPFEQCKLRDLKPKVTIDTYM